MLDVRAIDQLAQRLQSVLPPGLAQAGEDLRMNMRDVLSEGLNRMDLVTREEFDVQRALLERTRHRMEALEWRIAALESAGQRPKR